MHLSVRPLWLPAGPRCWSTRSSHKPTSCQSTASLLSHFASPGSLKQHPAVAVKSGSVMAAGNNEGVYKVEELARCLELLGRSSDTVRYGGWSCTVNWPVNKFQLAVQSGSDDGPRYRNLIVRLYNHATDFASLQDICRHVYGGEDKLPTIVEKLYLRDDSCRLLVLQDSTGITAIVGVSYWPGGGSWVFGLRVAPSEEGGGLGTLLMRCALTIAAHERTCVALTASIVPNLPSRQIMRKLGYRLLRPVVLWPQLTQLDAILAGDVASRHLACPPGAQRNGAPEPPPDRPPEAAPNPAPAGDFGSAPTMLEAGNVPWLGDADVACLAARWRPCTGFDELESYLRLARGDWPAAGLEAADDTFAPIISTLWLPTFYAAWAVCGEKVASALAENRVRVLGDLPGLASSSPSREHPGDGLESSAEDGFGASREGEFGVMVVVEDAEFAEHRKGVLCVSIVASSDRVAKAGMLHASLLERRFVVFVDIRRPDDRKLWMDDPMDGVDDYLTERMGKYVTSLFGEGGTGYILLGRCLP